jgi:hypothetical protein
MVEDRPMSAMAFDTHAAVKELQSNGLEEPLAAAIVKIVANNNEARLGELVTKSELRAALGELKAELKGDIKAIDLKVASLETRIEQSANKLLIWMFGMLVAFAGVIGAIVKLL